MVFVLGFISSVKSFVALGLFLNNRFVAESYGINIILFY
jgi:hypothetical protein